MRDLLGEHRIATQSNFKVLYDHYLAFCRKLRFVIKGALASQEDFSALEIISDYLDRNERDLEKLHASIGEKKDMATSESFEVLLGRLLMENEDYQLLQKLAEARKKGGPDWEALQSILNIDRPRHTLDISGESV
jgi:hypothetical protein